MAALFGMILNGQLSVADLASGDVQYMRTLTQGTKRWTLPTRRWWR